MFYPKNNAGYDLPLPGVARKTLVYGEKTLMTEFLLDGGTTLPVHRHPYEQTGYLVKGRLKMTIGAETFDAGPGDAWCIRENVDHGAYAVEDSVAMEVFAPVREDYLPKNSDK